MFAPDFPFQFFTLHAQIKFFKILQPSSFPLSCLRRGYIKKNTACFSGPSTVVCFLGARLGLCFAQSSPCTAHHSHRVIVLGGGMQGVTALLSELTLAEQTAVVKAQLQMHPGAILGRWGGAAVPALVDTSPSLPNELEPGVLILSEPTWETQQNAKKARRKAQHLKLVWVQRQAQEKGSSRECVWAQPADHSCRLGPRWAQQEAAGDVLTHVSTDK